MPVRAPAAIRTRSAAAAIAVPLVLTGAVACVVAWTGSAGDGRSGPHRAASCLDRLQVASGGGYDSQPPTLFLTVRNTGSARCTVDTPTVRVDVLDGKGSVVGTLARGSGVPTSATTIAAGQEYLLGASRVLPCPLRPGRYRLRVTVAAASPAAGPYPIGLVDIGYFDRFPALCRADPPVGTVDRFVPYPPG